MTAFPCPKCQLVLKAPKQTVGTRTKCPKCGCPVQVPRASVPPVANRPAPVQVPRAATAAVANRPAPSAPRRAAAPLRQPDPPRPKANVLLMCGLCFCVGALVAGSLAFYVTVNPDVSTKLRDLLKNRGAPDNKAGADNGATNEPNDRPGNTQREKPADTAPSKPAETAPAKLEIALEKPASNTAVQTVENPPVKPVDNASTKTVESKPIKTVDITPDKIVDNSPGEPLKGDTRTVDDLKATPLNLSPNAQLPCLLWADADGSAFFALERGGMLRRISFPDCKVTKEKNLERKFTWMSLSAEGLLLSCPDAEQIWVVDPATLEVKNNIAVPKLKRAVSAPGLSVAVACDASAQYSQDAAGIMASNKARMEAIRSGKPLETQKLYVVDLVKKKAVLVQVPEGHAAANDNSSEKPAAPPGDKPQTAADRLRAYQDLMEQQQAALNKLRAATPFVIGVDAPAVTPDGAYVFTQGAAGTIPGQLGIRPVISRFSLKDGELLYKDSTDEIAGIDGGAAGIAFSQDAKWFGLACPQSVFTVQQRMVKKPSQTKLTSPIYSVDALNKPHCVLEQGEFARGELSVTPQAVGLDPKGRYFYSQTGDHDLAIFASDGTKQKQYLLDSQAGRTELPYSCFPAQSVQQYLVHPSGNQLVMLTQFAVYAVELPKDK
jgi:hypothetical protein